MSAALLMWLAASTAVFVTANGLLKVYAAKGSLGMLAVALVLFTLGNLIMAQVMRGSGLGLAIAVSSVFQLLAITGVALVVFGERPTGMQMAGMALGVVAVALIAWPQGGTA